MRLPSLYVGYRAWLAALVTIAILVTAILALALALAVAVSFTTGPAWAA